MPQKTPPALYEYTASPCGGYSPQGAPLKQWYSACKQNGFICPTEMKIYHHSKGAGRNRETPKLSYAFGNQIDFRDAEYAYSLLKACRRSLRPSFSIIPHQNVDSVFRTLMKLGFDLSSFCLSIKVKGQSTRCQHEKSEGESSLFGNQVLLRGTDSAHEMISKLGEQMKLGECDQIVELFTRCSPVRPSILQELNGMGFDLTTLKVSIKKVLID
ncbi:hypothetical protein OTK49_26600 [Vibrio coralliirubri]|uniref:hypothetical protein n=1 Tax=Vibrio coralliirubri TaxID=1516159 RepID=UPI0022832EA2|nr:hypothetical protein [Vibrio coralliirubri]MCY9866111.1 hypothetical protein [Vibrio coralliirubri]